jgi:peptide/nickel transport system substrate-binding protein
MAACGGSKDEEATEPAAPGSGTTAAGAATAEPKRGGTFNENVAGDPPGLDPVVNFDHRQIYVNLKAYNGLLRYKLEEVEPSDAIVEMDLASKYEQIDPVTHVFTIPSGVTFHSGDPMTAEDVAFSINRMKVGAPTMEKNFLYSWIDAAKVQDQQTVMVTTQRPLSIFQYAMGWRPENSIVHKATVEKEGDLTKTINGTGPYKLTGSERGNVYRLERNPTYFKQGLPYFDRVNYFIIPDQTASLNAFRAGQLDITFSFPREAVEPTRRAVPKMEVAQLPGGGWFSLDMRSDVPPFNDQRVRNAFALSIDRQKLIDLIYQGDGVPVMYIPTHLKGFANPNPDQLPNLKQDLTKARQLFEAAGFRGQRIEFIFANTTPIYGDIASVIKEELSPIGIELDIKLVDNAEWVRAGQRGEFQIYPFLRIAALDPDEYTFARYNEQGSRRLHRGLDPLLNELTIKQRTTLDLDERKKVLHQLEQRAAEVTFDAKLVDAYGYRGWQGNLKRYFPSIASFDRTVEQTWKE